MNEAQEAIYEDMLAEYCGHSSFRSDCERLVNAGAIVVDIGEAVAALQASPELCETMGQLLKIAPVQCSSAGIEGEIKRELTDCQGALDTIAANRNPENKTQWGNERFYEGRKRSLEFVLELIGHMPAVPQEVPDTLQTAINDVLLAVDDNAVAGKDSGGTVVLRGSFIAVVERLRHAALAHSRPQRAT
jgi:hypothetical protein